MSGAGRKGSYRKGVTDDVLNGTPEPEEGELVARVKAPRGGNVIEIIVDDGVTEGLAVLPQKFRKLVWVKRGDHVIVSGAEKDIEVTGGSGGGGQQAVAAVKYRVTHVLYKEQIRHLKSSGLWPAAFQDPEEEGTGSGASSVKGGGGGAVVEAAVAGTAGMNVSKAILPQAQPSASDDKSPSAPPAPPSVATLDGSERFKVVLDDGESQDEEEDSEEEEEDDEEDDMDIPLNLNRRHRRPAAESSSEDETDDE
jgi:probable RNA-binding protein EIF1AD